MPLHEAVCLQLVEGTAPDEIIIIQAKNEIIAQEIRIYIWNVFLNTHLDQCLYIFTDKLVIKASVCGIVGKPLLRKRSQYAYTQPTADCA